MKISPVLQTLLITALTLTSCQTILPPEPSADELLDGPLEELTHAEQQQFLDGDIAFNDEIFTTSSGLGPLFVATSCGSCHPGDGKGHPFTTLTRFGQWDSTGNQYLDYGGPQLQDRAIPGYLPEEIPSGAPFSKLTPPANTGLGYLDALTDADIMGMSDPFDADGDGISGVPNWITLKAYLVPRADAATQNGKYIGRFGKKAGAYDLLQQTSGAYNQDIGITSVYEPVDPYSGLEDEPEISIETINDVVFYLQTLKAPIQRDVTSDDVIAGENVFTQIGCDGCHKPTLQTGFSKIAALSYQVFHPYTDLLLHDMGPELDDGYTEGNALTSEWRTPPLWGLGLSKDSQGGQYYLMHDGRATSIDAAIMLHGGEGSRSRASYDALSDEEKEQLITFLESL